MVLLFLQVLAVLASDDDTGLNGRVVFELAPNSSALPFFLQNKGSYINDYNSLFRRHRLIL